MAIYIYFLVSASSGSNSNSSSQPVFTSKETASDNILSGIKTHAANSNGYSHEEEKEKEKEVEEPKKNMPEGSIQTLA